MGRFVLIWEETSFDLYNPESTWFFTSKIMLLLRRTVKWFSKNPKFMLYFCYYLNVN